ncbi:MAG: fatty acid desaturase family protein [Alcanivoracaceae bacterium]|nr:fatty acid desaturase family protein [Alcanivoracaceae bacterium]
MNGESSSPMQPVGSQPRQAADCRSLVPLRAALAIARNWCGITLAIAAYSMIDAPLLYPVVVLLVGACQHGLAILAHDGAHRLLFRRASINDRVSELLLAWPLFASFAKYRNEHLDHHRHLNSDKDPDWARNRPDRLASKASLAARAAHLLGLSHALSTVRGFMLPAGQGESISPRGVPVRAVYYLALAVALSVSGHWLDFVLLWVVPYALVFLPLMRLRGIMEHWLAGSEGAGTRSVLMNPWLGFFFFPHNIGYHVEHHDCPAIPFYRLPEYARENRLRLFDGTDERRRVVGLRGMIAELLALLNPGRRVSER